MIGHQVYRYLDLSQDYDLFNSSFRKKLNEDSIIMDATEEDTFFGKIQELSPNIIINCIGILIEQCNQDILRAIQLNALLPHKLENLADKIDCQLIQMSTDCVFSGRKKESYLETDQKDGLDTYAKTKGLGEVLNESHLTLRTSVIGPELKEDGSELFNWFIAQEGKIDGYTQALWSGVSSLELAKVVKWAIDNDIKGLYHVTNGKPISKYELLSLMKKHTQSQVAINPTDEYKVDKSFVDSRQEINFKIPSYDEMIFNMVELIKAEEHLYSHYNIQ
tara:strand:+ start:107 stop:937 length:831 start_codon:yes stop_codon:yes gene_type:complete